MSYIEFQLKLFKYTYTHFGIRQKLKQLPETTDKFWGELWTTDKEFWLDEDSDVELIVCFDPPETDKKKM